MDTTHKALVDLSDTELFEAYRREVERIGGYRHMPPEYLQEVARRSQERHARALTRWTRWIAVATIVYALVAICQGAYQLWRGL